MSFDLTQKIKVVNPTSNIDELYGPYTSVANALAGVPVVLRQLGRTVGIIEGGAIQEYWFKNGTTDSDLVLKGSGETDTLDSVAQRGNLSSVPLVIKNQDFKFWFDPVNQIRLIGASLATGSSTAGSNTFIGTSILNVLNSTANYNMGIGEKSMESLKYSQQNVGIGPWTLRVLDTTTTPWPFSTGWNFAIGTASLQYLKQGIGNIAIGGQSQGTSGQEGKYNISVGISSLNRLTTGHRNIGIGHLAGERITTGENNICIGVSAGRAIATGRNNLFIGNGSGISNTNAVAVSNKLAIDQKEITTSLTATDDIRVSSTNYKDALISGDFVVREVNIDGKFSITPTRMPNATAAETKKVVWNPTTGVFAVKDDITPSTISANKQRFTGDTIPTKTLTQTPKTNSVAVILNGLELDEQGGDYTVSGTTVTLASEPLITDVIVIKYLY